MFSPFVAWTTPFDRKESDYNIPHLIIQSSNPRLLFAPVGQEIEQAMLAKLKTFSLLGIDALPSRSRSMFRLPDCQTDPPSGLPKLP